MKRLASTMRSKKKHAPRFMSIAKTAKPYR